MRLSNSLVLCAGLCASQFALSAQAAVLFSDTYTVSANSNDPSFDVSFTGRQGGSLSTRTNTDSVIPLGRRSATPVAYCFWRRAIMWVTDASLSIKTSTKVPALGGINTSSWTSIQFKVVPPMQIRGCRSTSTPRRRILPLMLPVMVFTFAAIAGIKSLTTADLVP